MTQTRSTQAEIPAHPQSAATLGWVLAASTVAIYLGGLGALPLLGFSEGRYASIAAEMWRSGDLVTPRYGGIVHLEKPPLAYWAADAAYHLFGLSEFAARMPAALAAIGTVLLCAFAGRRWFGRTPGLLAGFVLATLPVFLAMGRVLFTDMLLALGTTLYLVAVVEGSIADPAARRARARGVLWNLAAGVGLALAILSKFHLVLLVATLPLLVESVASRSGRLAWRALHPLAWSVGIALVAPWCSAVLARNPDLVQWVIEYQTRDRMFSEVHDRTGPPWFYLGVLALGALPWWPALLAAPWRRRVVATRSQHRPDLLRLCWWCLLLPLVVFSSIGSKRFNYLPPILPAFGLLVGVGLAGDLPRWLGIVMGVLARIWLWVPSLLVLTPLAPLVGLPAQPLALTGAGVVFLLAALGGEWARRRPATAAGGSLAPHQLLPLLVGLAYAGALPLLAMAGQTVGDDLNSHRGAALAAQPFASQGAPVAMYYLEAGSVGFYLEGEPLVLIGVPRQAQWSDPETRDRRYFPDDDEPERLRSEAWLRENPEWVVITKHKYVDHLRSRVESPLETIYDGGRYIVLRRAR